MIPTHHIEHCVQDMNEQSLSYHSATLSVTAFLPACLGLHDNDPLQH